MTTRPVKLPETETIDSNVQSFKVVFSEQDSQTLASRLGNIDLNNVMNINVAFQYVRDAIRSCTENDGSLIDSAYDSKIESASWVIVKQLMIYKVTQAVKNGEPCPDGASKAMKERYDSCRIHWERLNNKAQRPSTTEYVGRNSRFRLRMNQLFVAMVTFIGYPILASLVNVPVEVIVIAGGVIGALGMLRIIRLNKEIKQERNS